MKNNFFNKILIIIFIQLSSLNCFANSTANFTSLSDLNIGNEATQITAPYSVLSQATYTADLNIYQYKNLTLKIIDHSNPNKIKFQISKRNDASDFIENKVKYKLPWWSQSAPAILKKLDFSQVNGDLAVYKIDENYRLTLLSHQGCWGKVYALEKLNDHGNSKIICAVKLLLTKPNDKSQDFRLRHKTEIENNIISTNFDIAVKTYGIIENDPDHYLMFLEYGQDVKERFSKQSLNVTLQDLTEFFKELNTLYKKGYAHGDLNLGNLLYIGDKIKLCDWYSLINIKQNTVNDYRYIGDNLPPEAIRAFYYDKALKSPKIELEYALDQDKQKIYLLHPIAADRFCLGVSLMEIIVPDLYKIIERKPFPKGLNPYSPESLEFWPKYIEVIKEMQHEMLQRANAVKDQNNIQPQMLHRIIRYIDLDPMQRSDR